VDLRSCLGKPVDLALASAALETQQHCECAAFSDWAIVGESKIRTPLFFSGLRQLLQILVKGRLCGTLRDVLPVWRRDENYAPEFSGKVSVIEALQVEDRVVLLALVGEWLGDWPRAFVRDCKAAGLTATDILRDLDYVPFWLANVVDEHFGTGTYSPTIAEINSAIDYLRKGDMAVNKTSVSRMLGRTDVFRKRRLHYLLKLEDELNER
jgi:hypothetical protein